MKKRKYIMITRTVMRAVGIYACADKTYNKQLINVFASALNQLIIGDTVGDLIASSTTGEEEVDFNQAFKKAGYVNPDLVVRMNIDVFNFEICNKSRTTRPCRLKSQFAKFVDLATSIGVYSINSDQLGNNSRSVYPMFCGISWYNDYVYLYFNDCAVKSALDKTHGYNLCYIDILLQLESGHAGSLFMFLCRYLPAIKTGKWENNTPYEGFSTETVFKHLGLDLLYQLSRDKSGMRLSIVDKAVEDLNKQLNLGLKVEKIRQGGKTTPVKTLKFTIEHPEIIEVREGF